MLFFLEKKLPSYLFILFTFSLTNAHAEGTQQLIPTSNSSNTVCIALFNGNDGNHKLGAFDCDPKERFYIHVSSDWSNEIIYLGMNSHKFNSSGGNAHFRVKDPNGNIVYPYSGVSTPVLGDAYLTSSSTTGYIASLSEAQVGPKPTGGSSGYDPISITPTMEGLYYIEFNTNSSNRFGGSTNSNHMVWLSYFDVTVAKTHAILRPSPGSHTAIDGRFFSYSWPMYNKLDGSGFKNIDVDYYVYHPTDSMVFKMIWDNVKPGGWNTIFTDHGLQDNGNISEDRKSQLYSDVCKTCISGEFPIFFNNPDPVLYPSATLIPDASFERYTNAYGVNCFEIYANKAGKVEILIDLFGFDFTYSPLTADVLLSEEVTAGTNCLIWDGLSGLGAVVSLLDLNIQVSYYTGELHQPIGDVEDNTNGFNLEVYRPITPNTSEIMFFDDSEVTLFDSYDFEGCSSNCHSFSGNFGDQKWLNTWWYGSTTTIQQIIPNDPSASLAVKWQDFFSKNQNNDVRLDWQSSASFQIDRFDIERSEDGEYFQKIGVVDYTPNRTDFSYLDVDAALLRLYSMYYRLVEVNEQGEHLPSQILEHHFPKDHNFFDAYITQNSNANVIYINFSASQNIQLKIIDAIGNELIEEQSNYNSGKFPVPVQGWSRGIYYVKIDDSQNSAILKFYVG